MVIKIPLNIHGSDGLPRAPHARAAGRGVDLEPERERVRQSPRAQYVNVPLGKSDPCARPGPTTEMKKGFGSELTVVFERAARNGDGGGTWLLTPIFLKKCKSPLWTHCHLISTPWPGSELPKSVKMG